GATMGKDDDHAVLFRRFTDGTIGHPGVPPFGGAVEEIENGVLLVRGCVVGDVDPVGLILLQGIAPMGNQMEGCGGRDKADDADQGGEEQATGQRGRSSRTVKSVGMVWKTSVTREGNVASVWC